MTPAAATLLNLLRAGAVLSVDAGAFYGGRWTPRLAGVTGIPIIVSGLRRALDELEAAGEIVALPSGTGRTGVVRWTLTPPTRPLDEAGGAEVAGWASPA